MEVATRILEQYVRLLKEGDNSNIIELYPQAISAVGTILSAVSLMHQSGVHTQCPSLLMLCASFFELEGMPVRAAALYIEAGDCLFAEGRLEDALECFLKSYKAAASTYSKAGKTPSSIALLMAAFTALKLGGHPFLKETVRQARSSIDKKMWESIRRTKYYGLIQNFVQAIDTCSLPQNVHLLPVLDEFSSLAVGNSLKKWLQVAD